MSEPVCILCFSFEEKIKDIKNTPLQSVYEELTDNIIEADSHPLCSICYAKLLQCKLLTETVQQHNSENQLEARPLLQLSIVNTDKWSLPNNSEDIEQHPDIEEKYIKTEYVETAIGSYEIEIDTKKEPIRDVGFVKGRRINLPKIDALTVGRFLVKNPSSAAQKNVKTSASERESYGDKSIAYVQLKRDGANCTVKCKVCTERAVPPKQYRVSVLVDEREKEVTHALCEDCPANEGCPHAAALVLWLHRRSEEPDGTPDTCYWESPTEIRPITMFRLKEMFKSKHKIPDPVPNTSVLNKFLDECKKRNIDCPLLRYTEGYEDKRCILSLHNLIWKYREVDCENFLMKIKEYFNEDNLNDAETHTRDHKSSVWFELRYGRITDTISYEVSRKTDDDLLVEEIFGAVPARTPSMKRSEKLQDMVRLVAEQQLGVTFTKCGLLISDTYPMIAASPAGINRQKCIIEIKCPSAEKCYKSYIKDGTLTRKHFTQVQIQMFCAKVDQCFFCVANTDFEFTKNVRIYPVSYDETYVGELIKKLVTFWERNIFPKLDKTVSM